MDYWSVLASIALGVIVYPFFVMFHIVVLSWNNNPCLCIIHVPSLSVPQLFMSLGRHRWWSSRESATLSVLGSSRMDRTSVCLIYMYVGNPVLPLVFSSVSGCLPVHPEWGWRGGYHDGLPVRCVLPFDAPLPCQPLSFPHSSSFSRTISPSITGTRFTVIETWFYYG